MSYKIFENVLTEEQEEKLLKMIDEQPWNKTLSRWTQQYVHEYAYNSKKILAIDGDVPKFITDLRGVFYPDADQFLINRYLPGEGIACHQDSPLFEDKVMSLSLGSDILFKVGDEEKYLKRRSLLVMYKRVCHGIDKRKSDTIDGKRIERGTRVSVTFRKVKR